jgi:hypothetical protein
MPERQCASCTRQKEWGCEAKLYVVHSDDGEPVIWKDGKPLTKWHKPAHLPLTLNGEETWACPRQTLFEQPQEWNRLFMLYGLFKRGFLPEAGAVLDQSNKLLQAFRIMDEVNFDCDESEAAERRAAQGSEGQPPPRKVRRR